MTIEVFGAYTQSEALKIFDFTVLADKIVPSVMVNLTLWHVLRLSNN
jgi:hypothetical protein